MNLHPDEYVEVSQSVKCAEVLLHLLKLVQGEAC
jgi:acetylornithine deacetylase/succinyl-diaminopimelate desuccinylase-like protein